MASTETPINYGPSTKDYIRGLKLEKKALDPNSFAKKEDLDAASKLIDTEITAAEKNLKLEDKLRAEAEAAEAGIGDDDE